MKLKILLNGKIEKNELLYENILMKKKKKLSLNKKMKQLKKKKKPFNKKII